MAKRQPKSQQPSTAAEKDEDGIPNFITSPFMKGLFCSIGGLGLICTVLLGLIAWFGNEAWDDLQDMKKSVAVINGWGNLPEKIDLVAASIPSKEAIATKAETAAIAAQVSGLSEAVSTLKEAAKESRSFQKTALSGLSTLEQSAMSKATTGDVADAKGEISKSIAAINQLHDAAKRSRITKTWEFLLPIQKTAISVEGTEVTVSIPTLGIKQSIGKSSYLVAKSVYLSVAPTSARAYREGDPGFAERPGIRVKDPERGIGSSIARASPAPFGDAGLESLVTSKSYQIEREGVVAVFTLARADDVEYFVSSLTSPERRLEVHVERWDVD